MNRVVSLLAAGVLLTGCGAETAPAADPEPRAPVAPPVAVPAADGPVQTRYAVTVLDDGGGAELCVGGVAQSLPPQCGGPPITNWDWADHEGDYEQASGVRWGEFHLMGTFDGERFTTSESTPADEFEAPGEPDHFVTTCDEPAGGWVVDPSLVSYGDENAAFRAAGRLPDYAGAFLDSSRDPRPPEQLDQALADGGNDSIDVSTWIVNVRVTENPARAESAIREVWGGGLCITTARHTEAELRRIQEQLDAPGFLGSGVADGVVGLDVIHDDGSIQAWADATYGEGLVLVSSALVPASG